jgi:hypothetical protein
MRRALLLLTALLVPAILPAQVSINFDDTSAPPFFLGTSPLSSAYSGLGVLFSGGGAILDQDGNFDVGPARSGRNFWAFNSGVVYTGDVTAAGPGQISFATPQQGFSIFSGSTATLTFRAFLGQTQVNEQVFSELDYEAWTPITFSGAFDRIELSNFEVATFDDMSTDSDASVPEPSSLALVASALAGLGLVRYRRTRSSK